VPVTAQRLAKATYVNSYRGGPLLYAYTNPPGVSLNRLELKKQMRYFFRAKTFCVLQNKCFGGNFRLSGREWPTIHEPNNLQMAPYRYLQGSYDT
jgi:hypothetical protein